MDTKFDNFHYRGFEVEIHVDIHPFNPLTEFDFLSKFIIFSKKYQFEGCCEDFSSPEEVMEHAEENGAILLPLHILDHSGIRMSVSDVHFRMVDSMGWDWGQAGFVLVEPEAIRETYGCKEITPYIREKAKDLAIGEVEQMDAYVSGRVVGYAILDGDEVVDSCWGFYITESTESDFVESEAQMAVDAIIDSAREEHYARLKAWSRNRVSLCHRRPCPCSA